MKQKPSLSNINNWIFDLDNTLYRADADFFSQIDKKITLYISKYLKIPETNARLQQKELSERLRYVTFRTDGCLQYGSRRISRICS